MQHLHENSSISIDLIGSDFTTKVSDTECSFTLKQSIIVPEHSRAAIALESFSMVYAVYLVKEGINDSFTITAESVESGSVSYEITIPTGNYTISELVSKINSLTIAGLATLNLDSLGFTINETSNVIGFTATYSNTFVSIGFSASAYVLVGLVKDTTSTFTSSTGAFPKMYSCAGETVLYIRVPNLTMSNINTKNVSSVIGVIPVLVVPGELIYYQSQSEPVFSKVKNYEISTIDIQITDEDMNPLGDLLTSSTFRIGLIIHFIYDIDRDIKIKNQKLINQQYIDNQFEDVQNNDAGTEKSKKEDSVSEEKSSEKRESN